MELFTAVQLADPCLHRRREVLGEVAADVGLTPGQVVLARLARPDLPVKPIVGVSRVAQIESALAPLAATLPDEACDRLERAG